MFKKIVLRNFRSFENLEFDMCSKKGVAQPFITIYGENGSGKTNLVQSIAFLKSSIGTRLINQAEVLEKLRTAPLGPESGEEGRLIRESLDHLLEALGSSMSKVNTDIRSHSIPSRMIGSAEEMVLSFTFEVNSNDAEYGMAFGTDGRILREYLNYVHSKNLAQFFNCVLEDGAIQVSLNDSVFSRRFQKDLKEQVGRYWGNHTLLAILNEQYSLNNPSFMNDNVHGGLGVILDYIRDLKLNVVDQPFESMSDLSEGVIPKAELSRLRRNETALGKFFTRLYSDVRGVYYKEKEYNDLVQYTLYLRKMIGGKVRDVPFEQESKGTRKLAKIFPPLMHCASGSVGFIDELDSNIHDNLVFEMMKEIIPEIRGQLIITTHNTSLLEVLDPRSVYVLRIDAEGRKDITSFHSIARTQRNHNNRDRYLGGVYGGIPYIGELNILEIADEYFEDHQESQ